MSKKEIGMYMIANYVYVGINAISNLFVSKILGPTTLGAISFFNAVDSNFNTFILGIIRSAIEREIPQLDDQDKKREYGEKAFLLTLFGISIFSIVYIIIVFFCEQPIMKQCALWMCVLSFVKGLYDCCRVWHKANFNILQVSYLMLLSAFAIPPIVLVLAYFFDFHGFWFGRIILVIVSLCIIIKWMPKFHLRKFDKPFIKGILYSGGPIIFFGLIQTVYQTIDKFILNSKVGLEQLGYYSIGAMAFSMMLLLPQSFVGAIFPRFVTNKEGNLITTVFDYSVFLQLGSLIVSIGGFYLVPILIESFLPNFEQSIPVINSFFFGFVSYASCQMKYVDLIRVRKIKLLLVYSIIPFIISLGLFFIFIYNNFGIKEMALLTSFNFFMLSTSLNVAWCKTNDLGVCMTLKNILIHIIFCLISLIFIKL